MSGFRNLNLQRTVSLFILFTALFFQIHTLYACDSMDGKPKQVCCCGEHDSVVCPMADNCGMHEQMAESACCELSYDIVNDVAMTNSASTADTLTLLLDSPQPPPVVDLQNFSPRPLAILSRQILATVEPPISSRGKSTYLHTQRLRL